MRLPFELMVDSASYDEPDPRHFGSLAAALKAFEELEPEWKRFAWIREYTVRTRYLETPGGVGEALNRYDDQHNVVVHMRDGVRV